ncbi:MAG: phosphohydrolase [Candidatus Omnitrophota bacterium]
MISKCPGQDKRNIKVENLTCPACGQVLEIFSDEIKVTCPKCKKFACRARLPSCVDWCKSAKSCIGEKLWKELKGGV